MNTTHKTSKPWYKKWWAITFFVLLFFYVIGSASSQNESANDSNVPYKITQSGQNLELSPAFKLASLEIGHNSPNQSLVDQFDALLKKLLVKCTDNESLISDYIYKAKTMIRDKTGESLALLEVAKAIDNSIPEDAVHFISCAEVAAAFVTLYTSQYSIPEYEVLDIVDLISGSTSADVLVKSFQKNTPLQEMEKVAQQIAEEINADEIYLYCSKEAQKANYSESFAKQYPNAIKECYLGKF